MSDRRFNPAHMNKLDNPERRKMIPPEETLALLSIDDQDDILDLGAGLGFFALPAAKLTNGTVYALDVAQEMLDALSERVTENNLENVAFIKGEIENIPMEAEKVDHIIASMVLHEVEPLAQGLKEIMRVLKPGGSCLCVEWEKKEMEQGPPLNHRIHSSDMKKELEAAGFYDVAVIFPSASHYVITFKKK